MSNSPNAVHDRKTHQRTAIEIDDRVVQVLALHQLMATDLRLVLAVSSHQ